MLAERYRAVRSFTTALAAPLSEEDAVVQSMPDASPAKWHLAHTTWFFETFVLARTIPSYEPVHPAYAFLFNSYYEAVGDRHPRPERGLITRPSLAEVLRYRARVDEQVLDWLGSRGELKAEIAFSLTLGLHHEQQHQELLLTDIHHAFSRNPMRPAYRSRAPRSFEEKHPESLAWIERPEGLFSIGHQASPGRFAFDNESPRHRTFVERYALGSRLVTNAEYLEFILDGGYRRAELWLSDGWATAHARGWEGPLYWERPAQPGRPPSHVFTLRGLVPLDPRAPVSNVSFYEADAFARWATARLPTEAEWEIAAEHVEIDGNFVERDRLEPTPVSGTPNADVPAQLFGDLWEWTASPYVAYPGFVPFAGDLGEYNGKFMCNQTVLRGGILLDEPEPHPRVVPQLLPARCSLAVHGHPAREAPMRQTALPVWSTPNQAFFDDVVSGLARQPKTLPCKYFYDERGSELFDRICELDAYYPTRTELGIMECHAGEMAAIVGRHARLVELGSGSSLKTRILLDRLADLESYVPVDISREYLLRAAATLAREYPALRIAPVCADYSFPFRVPDGERPRRTVVYFPGSTIGNLVPAEARRFLKVIAQVAGAGGGLLIGVDLKKDPAILHAAYNDPEGVTAAFNLNLLVRINRELDGNFDLSAFRHQAFYDSARGRIEMQLVSTARQIAEVGGTSRRADPRASFSFEAGEAITTEYSYKYDVSEFQRLAASAGFAWQRTWTDENDLFSVQYHSVEHG